ncbi:hypothetical protein X736_31910 [Mesorhizobium sp. L2C089B000]|nr:hypothetical protein X736_31910 [Mesorhizobium sp. L2C089B000]
MSGGHEASIVGLSSDIGERVGENNRKAHSK